MSWTSVIFLNSMHPLGYLCRKLISDFPFFTNSKKKWRKNKRRHNQFQSSSFNQCKQFGLHLIFCEPERQSGFIFFFFFTLFTRFLVFLFYYCFQLNGNEIMIAFLLDICASGILIITMYDFQIILQRYGVRWRVLSVKKLTSISCDLFR